MPINTETKILGLFGNPVEHSLSPYMHNQVFTKMGLNCLYLPFKVESENLAGAVEAIRSLNFTGVNVTIPHKTAVIEYLDDLSPAARACGAVNVIKNDRGRLMGFNTDGSGFVAALREAEIDLNCRVLFIGAGGAARSLAFSLAQAGVAGMDILDLEAGRAEMLARDLSDGGFNRIRADVMSGETFSRSAATAEIIVNCSPAGMHPDTGNTPVSDLKGVNSQAVLCDIIYNPLRTRFLHMAQERGLKTVGGLSMFVHQGAQTLNLLLGIDPPVDWMMALLASRLQ